MPNGSSLNDWVNILSVGTNVSILMVGMKLVRQFSRIELKVETMWSVFMRKFGEREEDSDS